MLVAGDEFGRTQRGNNNAYCQDNEIGWVSWDLSPGDRRLLEFTRQALSIFHANPVLRRRSFFTGQPVSPDGIPDLTWIRSDGQAMTEAEWSDPRNHVLGMLMHGRATDEVNERGRPIFGDTLLLLVNGGYRSRYFELPELPGPGVWEELLNTAHPGSRRVVKKPAINLVAHSLILLRFGDRA
jgi:glycogen operon protein